MAGSAAKEVEEYPALDKTAIESFYQKDLGEIPPQAMKILTEYSQIPAEEVEDHIIKIRDEAWTVHKYPCVGRFSFLHSSISSMPIYPEILSRVRSGSLFLDLGCCVGQEIRQLVHDGAPAENLYGSDIEQGFLDIGYKLFRDADSLKSTFFAADVYDEENPGFKEIEGRLEIIWAGSFLHLFSWEGQVRAVKRMMKMLKPEKNVVVAGKNLGHMKPGAIAHANAPQKTMYRHDAESFKKLWKEAADKMGTKWDVYVTDDKLEKAIGPIGKSCAWATEETLLLRFQARRL